MIVVKAIVVLIVTLVAVVVFGLLFARLWLRSIESRQQARRHQHPRGDPDAAQRVGREVIMSDVSAVTKGQG